MNIGNDPLNNNMFSKAGRFTSEKYIIFQRKEDILFNQPQKKNNPKINFIDDEPKKRVVQTVLKKIQIKKSEPKIVQPFFTQVSREKTLQLKSIKHPPPPIGHYHPKFNEIDLSVHHSNLHYTVKKTQSKKIEEQLGDFNLEMQVIPDKLSKKIIGKAEFDHQTKRKDNLLLSVPHDKRFEIIPDTYYSTRSPRPPVLNFSKCLDRDSISSMNKLNNKPSYDTKIDFIRPKIQLNIPNFQSTTSRSFSVTVLMNDFSITINSHRGRPHKKNMTNRQNLKDLNQKMIEMNDFKESKFQSVVSSFPAKKMEQEQQNWFDYDTFSIVEE